MMFTKRLVEHFAVATCLVPSAGDGLTFINTLLPRLLVPDLPGSREGVEMTLEPWKPSQQPLAVGNRVQISRKLFSAIYKLPEKKRRQKRAVLQVIKIEGPRHRSSDRGNASAPRKPFGKLRRPMRNLRSLVCIGPSDDARLVAARSAFCFLFLWG
jgi:hypothetical protein